MSRTVPESQPSPPKCWSIHTLQLCGLTLLCLAIFFLGRQTLNNIAAIEKEALVSRTKWLPDFAEAQKTLSNLEALRHLVAMTYASTSRKERRNVRVEVDALTSESVLYAHSDFQITLRRIAKKNQALNACKDKIEASLRELELLEARRQEILMTLIRLTPGNGDSLALTGILRRSLARINPAEFRAAKEAELVEAEEAQLRDMSKKHSGRNAQLFTESLAALRQANSSRLTLLRGIEVQQNDARAQWQETDLALREIRDHVSMVTSDSTFSALESISAKAHSVWRSFLILAAVLAVFLLLYHVLAHLLLVRPIRWASHKLAALRNGDLAMPPIAVHIRELVDITQMLDTFSLHLSELYANTDKLKADASRKRDLEIVTQAVFRASLDGYVLWTCERVLMVSEGARSLLGLGPDDTPGPGWYPQETFAALANHFFTAPMSTVWREEVTLGRFPRETLPCEITHIIITQSGERCLLSYIRDLRQQKHTESVLMQAKEAAEQAARAKSDFLARMSHEIRTPLNGVLGLTHLMRETPLSPRQNELLGKVQSSASILLGVINDILDFSKIEQGRLELEQLPFTLGKITQSLHDMLTHQAVTKGLEFRVLLAPQLADRLLTGDRLRLTQVLLNLCSNAIKFTEHGSVHLTITDPGDMPEAENARHIAFEVRDTGIGLSPEQAANLFKPFAQADTSTTRKYGGTGLGLMISKLLVECMGGKISLQSALGQGSTFSFRLSLPEGDPAAGAADAGKEAPEKPDFSGTKILVAEDNLINQEVIQAILEEYGIEVTLAENGQEALDLLPTKDFACVFMDIQMPVMDGLDAAKAIRKQGHTLPVIAMTAHVLQEDIDKSLAAGMNAHLTKPVDPQELGNCLRTWLSPPEEKTAPKSNARPADGKNP